MPELAYVNGTFCPPEKAVVSINDRGFQFADSVYEVIVAYGAKPFKFAEHLKRLHRSLMLIDMEEATRRIDFEAVIREGIERAALPETMVYLQVTRGVQPRSHICRGDLTPTVVATFRPKPVVDPAIRASGVSVLTTRDTRWAECEIKSTALLPNVVAVNRARRDGFYDAVFVSPAGCIREGTSSNLFVIRKGILMTPAADPTILHGVTRQYILECAARTGVPIKETPLTVAEFETPDEAFMSSTTIEILGITRVNKKTIGNGRPGPVTQGLYAAFLDGVKSDLA